MCGIAVYVGGAPPDLLAAIARLVGDPVLRRRLGEQGRRRAEALFGWDRIAGEYEAVLSRAAAGGR